MFDCRWWDIRLDVGAQSQAQSQRQDSSSGSAPQIIRADELVSIRYGLALGDPRVHRDAVECIQKLVKEVVDLKILSPWEQVQAILRWSALPGASRHHWGTDIDVYDRAAVGENFNVQLSVEEVAEGGVFAPMHHRLDEQIAKGRAEGFYRPYEEDLGGVAPERWHLSYAPLAARYQKSFSREFLIKLLSEKPIALKDAILENVDEIIDRYVEVPLADLAE